MARLEWVEGGRADRWETGLNRSLCVARLLSGVARLLSGLAMMPPGPQGLISTRAVGQYISYRRWTWPIPAVLEPPIVGLWWMPEACVRALIACILQYLSLLKWVHSGCWNHLGVPTILVPYPS